MIPTRVHAVVDYLLPLGIAVLGRSGAFSGRMRRLMTVGPAWNVGYSVATRYEGGAFPLLSMRQHLACDVAGALSFLAAGLLWRKEPPEHRLLAAAIGLSELVVIAMTDRTPGRPKMLARPDFLPRGDAAVPAPGRSGAS